MRIYENIIHRIPIDKGWSGDRKYCAVTAEGAKYLLRITSADRAHRFFLGYLRMQEAAALGVPMCQPVEFGQCPEGTYAIHSWVEGVDAEGYIPALSVEKQYAYGLDAGRILRQLHTLPAPADVTPWSEYFNAKIDRKIKMYEDCPLKYEKGHLFVSFIAENRHLLSDRPQTYQHGDYHIGNMMISREGVLTIIDFDRDDFGDPWEEFNRIVWCAQAAPAFASGMVDGYFDGDVPTAFWKLLALYISSNTLSSLPWAISFGDTEIATMRKQAAQVLAWYDGMQSVVPAWYQPGECRMNLEMIAKTEQFLKDTFAASEHLRNNPADRDYRLEHSYRVANIAKAIADAEGFDETHAVIAGLLHDISYCEEMVTREDRLNHGRRSAAIARPFLESLGLPADAVNEICYGIAIHVDDKADFEWERTPFCETVGDADNIDRFDAYRIYETLEYLKFSEMSLEDKCEKVIATMDRLTRLKEMKLGTATAQELWIQRLDYYIGFYAKLKAQLDNSTAIR